METMESKENFKIEILLATPEDARSIREVQYKTWLATYPNEDIGVTVDDVEDRFKDAFTDENIKRREEQIKNQPDNEQTYVAKSDGKVVGFCTIIKHQDKNQLLAIYVSPDFHGRGIGKDFWDKASQFLDPTKDTAVELASYNSGAVEFYKKLGFEDTGKRWADKKFKMKSGAVLPEMEMVIKAEKT